MEITFTLSDLIVAAIITGIFTIIVSIVTAHLTYRKNRLHDMQSKVYLEKQAFYNKYYEVQSKITTLPDDEAREFYKRLRFHLLATASDKIIFLYFKWKDSPKGSEENLKCYLQLLIEMRKDLGFKNTKVSWEDLRDEWK